MHSIQNKYFSERILRTKNHAISKLNMGDKIVLAPGNQAQPEPIHLQENQQIQRSDIFILRLMRCEDNRNLVRGIHFLIIVV
jgi:hypothetical protein